MSIFRFLIAMALLVPLAAHAAPNQLYNHGNPSAAEQYMLELVNRARANPAAEGVWLSQLNISAKNECPELFSALVSDFANYPAVPPVAFQAQLGTAARLHSQDMLANQFFAHTNLSGLTPSQRTQNQGYTGNVSENISMRMYSPVSPEASTVISSQHADLLIDCGVENLGHRKTILDLVSLRTEVGIGYATDGQKHYSTQNFGYHSEHLYVLGVVYQDLNNNQFYDIGEGLSDVTITPDMGDYYTISGAAGGYAIPMPPVTKVETVASIQLDVNEFDSLLKNELLDSFKAQELAKNPLQQLTVTLTASGGTLANVLTQQVTVTERREVLYQILWPSSSVVEEGMLMLEGSNVKADFVITASAVEEPITPEPEPETPVVEEPITPEPEMPVVEEPITPEPETPVVEEPITPEPETPVVEEPITPEPETPVVEEPITPEPETPVVEEPITPEPETPVIEEPITPEPETPVVEEPITPAPTNCPNDICSYTLDLNTMGFYVMRVNLPAGRAEGQWGLSINNSSGLSDGGFSSGSVLRENGEAEGFTSFYLTQPTAVTIETQEYTGAMDQLRVQIKKDNTDLVYGPVLSNVGSLTQTEVLAEGYYVVTVASLANAPRGYFGIGIYGSNIRSIVDVGGMIDTTSGLGFIGIPVTTPITLNFSLFYGVNYGELGAAQPRVELFRDEGADSLISVWASDAQ